MNEDFKINNENYQISKYDTSVKIYSELKSYDITGINGYNNKNHINKKKILNSKQLSNNHLNNGTNKDLELTKINYIKSMIKRPDNMLYDGYLCERKKPTINYLLNKTKNKENTKFIEENKLFKNPYPLLKNLSNRKVPNKSRKLITGILSAEFNDLSVEQKIEMKYKPNKSLIKQPKLNFPTIKTKFNHHNHNNDNYLKTEGNFSISIFSNPKKKDLKIGTRYDVKDINLNGFLRSVSLTKQNDNKKIIPFSLKKFKSCHDNIKLKEHSTMTDNILYLRKSSNNKYKIKNMKHILKDISLLKHNNHLMSISIKH